MPRAHPAADDVCPQASLSERAGPGAGGRLWTAGAAPVWDTAERSDTLSQLPEVGPGQVSPSIDECQELLPVAANCDVCGKGPGFGHNISHSHRRTKRRWNPNVQRVRAVVAGAPKRLYVCTSCLKAGKVSR